MNQVYQEGQPQNQAPQPVRSESKTAAIKTLAIVGLIATVLLLVWVFVQAVRIVPSAVTSLATVAESLQNAQTRAEALSISTSDNMVDSGDAVTISWTNTNREGTYAFSYNCVEGVDARVVTADGEATSVACDTSFTLESDTSAIDFIPTSDARRFIDVPFTVAFFGADEDDNATASARVTVVNTDIPQSASQPDSENEPENETPAQPEPEEPELPEEPPYIPPPTVYLPPETYTYTYYPESEPNGQTDLEVTFVSFGYLDRDDDFHEDSSIDEGDTGAIKFIVKNIGNRTSDSWTFEIDLPGSDYESRRQDGLRPNEYATVVVGFDTDDEEGRHDIEVTVDTSRDSRRSNDSFEESVRIR